MADTSARSAHADIYTRITADIVAAIQQGAGEWEMPWHHDGSSIARPRNVTSGKAYRGINVLALWVAAHRAGYTGGIWGTYRQWAERGCQVRRGETATTVVFWKQIGRRDNGEGSTDDPDRPITTSATGGHASSCAATTSSTRHRPMDMSGRSCRSCPSPST